MRKSVWLATCGSLFLLGVVWAADPAPTSKDARPWHVSAAQRVLQAEGTREVAPAGKSAKYLSIDVGFNIAAEDRKPHKFRVVDRDGKEQGELFGWYKDRSQLIFEGTWDTLNGLYLDGHGHREPLFTEAPVREPDRVFVPPQRPEPMVVEERREVVRDPNPPIVPRTVVDEAPDHVVVHDRVVRDKVVLHDDVVRERRDVVVDDRRDKVVVHDRGDTVVVRDGVGRVGVGVGVGGRGVGVGGALALLINGDEVAMVGAAPAADLDPGPGPAPALGEGPGVDPGPGTAPAEANAQAKAEGEGTGPGKGTGSGSGPGPGSGSGNNANPGPGPGGKSGDDCPPGPGGAGTANGGSGGSGGSGGGGGGGGGGGPGGLNGLNMNAGMARDGGPGGPGGVGGAGAFGGAGGMGGEGGQVAMVDRSALKFKLPPAQAMMVLYISCGEDSGPGKVYQVDESGRVLGIVNLPYTATGIALHRESGLVLAVPRDGGKLLRIDDSGKLSTIMEKNKEIVNPVDVAIAGRSDAVVIADNMSDLLGTTTALGGTPKIYQRIDGQKWTQQEMSIAVTFDKHVLYGTNSPEGIYRYAGDETSFKGAPLLPGNGGVAADTATLKWAASQSPNQVYVFEGEELAKKLRLPAGKSHYRHGIMSFAPTSTLVVAARPSDEEQGEVWLIQYGIENDNIRNLFPWDKERMVDFVVGPRMYWERNERPDYRSIH